MITYELAKQLKDAGFPPHKCPDLAENEIVCGLCGQGMNPTLSELIEACTEIEYDFTFHLGNIKDNIKWWAEVRLFGVIVKQVECSTPEEAVAKLWLELNKK